MEVDPPPPPPPPMANYFDPESSGRREEYRRYRKRLSSSNASPLLGTAVSKFSEARLFCDGNSIQRRPNAGLLLEDIKQEAADISDFDSLDESKLFGSGKKRASLDASDAGFSSGRQAVRSALKSVKLEEDMPHEGETTSTIFASLLDSAIQGLMPFSDVILQFERTCRNASESIRFSIALHYTMFNSIASYELLDSVCLSPVSDS
jgi:nuclear pore complex protein Nup107